MKFSISVGHFCSPGSGSGSSRPKEMRIRIRNAGLMKSISFYLWRTLRYRTCRYLFIVFSDWLIFSRRCTDWLICVSIDRCTLYLICYNKIYDIFSGVCGKVQERRADRPRFLPSLALKIFSTAPFSIAPLILSYVSFFLGLSVGVPSPQFLYS